MRFIFSTIFYNFSRFSLILELIFLWWTLIELNGILFKTTALSPFNSSVSYRLWKFETRKWNIHSLYVVIKKLFIKLMYILGQYSNLNAYKYFIVLNFTIIICLNIYRNLHSTKSVSQILYPDGLWVRKNTSIITVSAHINTINIRL